MNVYLASRYTRRDEMKEVRERIEALGHKVTSSWLDFEDSHPTAFFGAEEGASEPAHVVDSQRAEVAVMDVTDVLMSDCLILFTPAGSRGGCQVELGMALALFIRTIVVGPRGNVFHFHPSVEHYDDLDGLIAAFEANRVPNYENG